MHRDGRHLCADGLNVNIINIFPNELVVYAKYQREAGFQHDKVGCLNNAVRFAGRCLPHLLPRISPLTVYFLPPQPCEAYWQPEGPGGQRIMLIGDKIFEENQLYAGQDLVYGEGHRGKRGIADQLRDVFIAGQIDGLVSAPARSPQQTLRGMAVIIHEFGHFLHELTSPAVFWSLKKGGANDCYVPPALGMQVSGYSTKNPLEFVAEVFTGLVFGIRYSPDVIRQYRAYGGVEI